MQEISLTNLLTILRVQDGGAILAAYRDDLERSAMCTTYLDASFYHSSDSFDESFFGMSVGKIIDIQSPDRVGEELLTHLEDELPYAYTIARMSSSKLALISQLVHRGWTLLDTTVDLVCKIQDQIAKESDLEIVLATPADLAELIECATAFSYGRLFSDPLFTNGEALYSKWIQNSFEKVVADEVYVARDMAHQLVGFASVKNRDLGQLRYWEVPLLSRHPHAKKQGVASALLSHICNQALENGIPFVTIGTHGNNIPAQRAYSSVGFRPFDTGVTLRFHKPHLAKE